MTWRSGTLNSHHHTLATYTWESAAPKAVVLVAHGMAEHAARYDRFARFLSEHGYTTRAHDHRGHGQSISDGDQGYFGAQNGWNLCIDDLHRHTEIIRELYPDLPIILFGHSMGSMMAQEYIIRHGDQLQGAILSGTSGPPDLLARVGTYIAMMERFRIGKRGLSPLLNKLSFDGFNQQFKPCRTDFDWLSRDHAEVDKYIADPLCGFPCTTQLWVDLLCALREMSRRERKAQIPKELALFIFSGAADPVGKNTRGILKLIDTYRDCGLSNIHSIFYPGGRHEMLNETCQEQVHADILTWLDSVVTHR